MAQPQGSFESFYGVPADPANPADTAAAGLPHHHPHHTIHIPPHHLPHRGGPPAADPEKAGSATASPDREMADGEDPTVPDPPEDSPDQPPHHGCPHGHGHRRGGRFHHHKHHRHGGSGSESEGRGWGGHWGGPWGWGGHHRRGRGWGGWGGHHPHGRGGFAHMFGPGGPLNASVPCPRCGTNLLDVFLGPNWGAANEQGDWKPDVDVFDTESAFVVHVPLPGANKEDVGVTWEAEGCELAISGVVHRPGDEEFLKKLAVGERKVGAFERKIKLGSRAAATQVDVDGITAMFENGLLVVDVPKLKSDFVDIKKVDIE